MTYKLIIFFLSFFYSTLLFGRQLEKPEDASIILKEALVRAKQEKKNVLIMFTASWCINCHILKDSLFEFSSEKANLGKYFGDNYVIRYLTVSEKANNKQLENPGATEMFKKYNRGDNSLPLFVILDPACKLLQDSFMYYNNGNSEIQVNIGRPFLKEEVEIFINKLKATSSLNDHQLDQIRYRCNPKLF